MPENEFEKKVSSEMQDLKFRPSEKVWLHVEDRIRKKKKRRIFLVIFLLAGLGLLGYWQWNNLFDKNENDITKIEPALKENTPVIEEKNTTLVEEKSKITETTTVEEKNNKPQNPIVNKKKNQATVDQIISKTDPIIGNKNQPDRVKKIKEKSKQQLRKENEPKKDFEVNEKNDLQVIPDEPNITKTIKPESGEKDLKVKDTTVQTSQLVKREEEVKKVELPQEEKKIDSITKTEKEVKEKTVRSADTLNKIQAIKDSSIVVKKDSHSKKWKWGLEFTPGISSLNEKLFSFYMMKSAADVFANPSTGAGSAIPLATPSESHSGFAFQIGAFAKKQMTQRSSLSIGLQYGYYNDHINVGRDTLILTSSAQFLSNAGPSIYRASNTFQDKTNGYHFIEIPVNYHLQLNKNKQKPFALDAGFTIGRLVATNAVMYDTAFRGIYYKQTNLLNKTQFTLTSGFSWTIVGNKRIQWSFGPAVDIHLNSLLNSPFEDKKYLFFAGLRSRILFSSKK